MIFYFLFTETIYCKGLLQCPVHLNNVNHLIRNAGMKPKSKCASKNSIVYILLYSRSLRCIFQMGMSYFTTDNKNVFTALLLTIVVHIR